MSRTGVGFFQQIRFNEILNKGLGIISALFSFKRIDWEEKKCDRGFFFSSSKSFHIDFDAT